MAEKEKMVDPVEEGNEVDFVAELTKVKESMVDKTLFEKAQAENAKLKEALLKGAKPTIDVKTETVEDLKKQYQDNIKNGGTDLRGFETALKLREAVINETGSDPFMSEALYKIDPNFGERVAEKMQDLVDSSNGDPGSFKVAMSQGIK